MTGLEYYLTAAALWIGCAVKLRDLTHRRRDPHLRAICTVLLVSGGCYFFSAPPSIAALNHVTRTPNLAAPVVYSLVTAFAGACIVLIMSWRGDRPDAVRRNNRRVLAACALLSFALFALFAAGDADVERRTDLDTYYATTPYIAQMIGLYMLAHMTAAVVTTTMCWNWSRRVTGWVKAGLVVLSVGWALDLLSVLTKLTAVAARWSGHNLDPLSTSVAPRIVAVAALCAVSGILLPVLGPRVREFADAVLTYRRLGPLWRTLVRREERERFSATLPWWTHPDMRALQRETGIRDGLRRLTPALDEGVREDCRRRFLQEGGDAGAAEAASTAAMITVAVGRADTRHLSAVGPVLDPPALPSVREELVQVSRAIGSSAVKDLVRHCAAESRHPA